ncbi:HAMP domain-containing sensor histidine kinase [Crassaminicella profunda]|uniref:HAMP domain-containing sensor histidine kinase n=1 Tax=Crassaminicella profunda TaxID=1286698 RepID=UPI001CA6C408|nr:HAMP domain-containing sensor histidine kinase [Crassaminicella profunda]QZY54953.1 HAMP domain-containing histidine kinase [Crassaminicella profunda]
MKTSIKVKWTIFIILLLIFNLSIISFFMLRGIEKNQRQSYEALLKDNSKTANLYIRERFLSSDEKDFQKFYVKNAESLVLDLGRILDLSIVFYDMAGKQIGSVHNDVGDKKKLKIMTDAIHNKIVYEKNGQKIIYLAPVYDFEKQIGVLRFEYYTQKERNFYEDIKKLFFEVGIASIVITYLLARFYFSKVVNNILAFKKSVKEIEKGDYESVKILDEKDEFGDLSRGIYFMSNKIKENIEQINIEKEKLQLAVEKLQSLEKQQKEFIGNITHEFKTPLTVIKAQIDLMSLYKDDDDMVCKSKEIAEKELKRVDSMIENTLYLSRLEKYDFELQKEKVDTKKLLMDICRRMGGKASKFGIEMVQDLQKAYVLIDAESFMQIFINLIDNGIKYNVNGGKIYIRSYIKDNKNCIEIEDTGIGIPLEHRRKIFEPFYTVDKNRSKKFSGTGLGLSLVNKLLKRQKGEIRLLDDKEGTCFEVSFPIYNEKIKK